MSGNKKFDFAILLSLGIGYIYLMSWIYWDSYYSFFGIPESALNISFMNIILSAWSSLVIMFAFIIIVLDNSGKRINSIEDISISLHPIILLLFLIIVYSIQPFLDGLWIRIGIIFSLLVIYIFIKIFSKDRIFEIGRAVKDNHGKIFIAIALLMLSIVTTKIYANVLARSVAKGVFGNNINLQLKDSDVVFKDYVLISNMGGKYYICEEIENNDKPSTFVINEDDVILVELNK